MEIPSKTIFYLIEKAIKEYRKFALKNIRAQVSDITIDQSLLLAFKQKYPEYSQQEIAELIFKDNASVTRMIESMVGKDYLRREIHTADRRKYDLQITEKGAAVLTLIGPVIIANREEALEGISEEALENLETTLQKIITNCLQFQINKHDD